MDPSPSSRSPFQRFQSVYTRAALGVLNFLLLFIAVNLVIGFSFKFSDKAKQVAGAYKSNPLGRPGMTALRDGWQLEHIDTLALSPTPEADIDQMLDDISRLNRQGEYYQPWVQFSTQQFNSKTVNVDLDAKDGPEFPHRRSILEDAAASDTPAAEVYTFGGSTMFGQDTWDQSTVASRLWSHLESRVGSAHPGLHIKVTNYGRLLYYSSQESLLFERLLRSGHRPKVAVFLDGLNDTIFMAGQVDQPNMTAMLRDLVEARQIGRKGSGLQDYTWIPMVQLAYQLRHMHDPQTMAPVKPKIDDVQTQSQFVLDTYRTNREEILRNGAAYGVKCYFFVQPVPFVHYDMGLSRTPIVYPDLLQGMYQTVYEALAKDNNVIFLGAACEDFGHRKVFVDDVHYAPAFTDYLAGRMADAIKLEDLGNQVTRAILVERLETEIDNHLLPWFDRSQRSMPWRGIKDPYRIWVSEVMLQQTQVDTVIPYYERFIGLFPTVFALASAELERVLKAWEGLGYYARARNLHRAAKAIVEQGGTVPGTWDEIRRIPGIGDYTAGAVLSMAFGQATAVLDGNVKRVLSRLYADADPKSKETLDRLWDRARYLVQGGRTGHAPDPSLHNQAMMELGALVCTPTRPRCEECPLRSLCSGAASGHPEAYPKRVPRKPTPHYDIAVGAIFNAAGELLLGLRPAKGLLGGLWELPGGKMEAGETAQQALVREAREELDIDIEVGEPLGTVHHAYSHFRVTLHAFLCRWVRGEPRPLAVDEFRWVNLADVDRYPFPKANKDLLKRLHEVRPHLETPSPPHTMN